MILLSTGKGDISGILGLLWTEAGAVFFFVFSRNGSAFGSGI